MLGRYISGSMQMVSKQNIHGVQECRLHLYKMAFHFSCISREIKGLIANIISALHKQQSSEKYVPVSFKLT